MSNLRVYLSSNYATSSMYKKNGGYGGVPYFSEYVLQGEGLRPFVDITNTWIVVPPSWLQEFGEEFTILGTVTTFVNAKFYTLGLARGTAKTHGADKHGNVSWNIIVGGTNAQDVMQLYKVIVGLEEVTVNVTPQANQRRHTGIRRRRGHASGPSCY